VWRIYFRKGIDYFAWSIAARDPASLAKEYGETKKENGDSSKSLWMSKNLPLFHP
jgi:hypothetical protein